MAKEELVRNEKAIVKELSLGSESQCVDCAIYNGKDICDALITNSDGIKKCCHFFKSSDKWERVTDGIILYSRKK